MTGLESAVLGWLVAAAGNRGMKKFTSSFWGSAQERALRSVFAGAVETTVRKLAAHDGEHLRSVLLEGRGTEPPHPGTDASTLQSAIRRWIETLDTTEFGGPGYLTEHGIDPANLADTLAEEIRREIENDARHESHGGQLHPLAEGLRFDEVKDELAAIRKAAQQEHRDDVESLGGGLPGIARNYTGRRAELDELRARIAGHQPSGTTAVHVIHGMPGVGKSEFTRRAAHEFASRYPDKPEIWLDLYGSDPRWAPRQTTDILEQLLLQARVVPERIPADPAGRREHWCRVMRSRRTLIVLDNARDSEQIRDVLPDAPGCLVLVTSRQWLTGLRNAQPLHLAALSGEEATELFRTIVGPARCADPDALRRVLQACGGLPLALTLVAIPLAFSQYRSAGDLADELEDTKATLDALEAGHESVRAAFEVSYRALDSDQRRAFRVLGWHPGPELTTQVLAALADLPPGRSRQLLKDLAERNLVEELPSAGVPGGPRYRFHDLIRSYTSELAQDEPAERAAASKRLLRSYRQTVTRVDQLRRPGHVQTATGTDVGETVPVVRGSGQARKWLVAERENLLDYVRSVPSELRPAMAGDLVDMSVALARHYRLFGYYAEARAYYDQVLNVDDFGADQHGTAEALRGRGQLARLERDNDAAREDLQRALEIHTSMGDERGMADCLRALGNVARQAGDPQRTAREHLQRALEIYRKLPHTPKNRFAEAHTLEGMGNLERDVSEDLTNARHYFEQSLTMYRELGDNPLGEANSLHGLGDVERLAGAHSDARAHLVEALRIYETLGDPLDAAEVLWRLGLLAAGIRDSAEACRHWHRAVAIFGELGDPFAETVRDAMRRHGC